MSDRFFLDTNIFVYSFDRSAVMKAQKATQLIRNALKTQKGIISYQVVQEFFNVALRKFFEPMKADDAEQYLGTVFRPWWACIPRKRSMPRRCISKPKAACPGTTH
jgi:predicted nucleic acid-binding protein